MVSRGTGDCSTLISGTINQTLTQSGQPSSFQMCSPGGQRGIALIYIPGEPGRLGSERAVGGWEASSEHPCRGREGIPIEKTQPQHCSRKGEQQNPPCSSPDVCLTLQLLSPKYSTEGSQVVSYVGPRMAAVGFAMRPPGSAAPCHPDC